MRIKYLSECILLILGKLSGVLEYLCSLWMKANFHGSKIKSKGSLVGKKKEKISEEKI